MIEDSEITTDEFDGIVATGRTLYQANPIEVDSELGPLQDLPGTWSNDTLPGRGWNMIALPFMTAPNSPFDYRLLLNQYNEKLVFNLVDKAVPNRGIDQHPGATKNTDQILVTIDYEQTISQVAAEDNPATDLAGGPGLPIHHEPGLWLHMLNERTDNIDIARLGTIPHGDAVLALGRSSFIDGPPVIDPVNGLPIGVDQDFETNPYLLPYKHFHDNPFQGLFDPINPHLLLDAANAGEKIVRTRVLHVDTAIGTGGINNIPFVTSQANAAEMTSTFWIQELEGHVPEAPKLRLQYMQIVMLDFFDRRGEPGLIRWPHVSINTLAKD